MKIHYLGSGSAEGFPGVFCGCEACNRARERKGKNIKTRSCALLNDKILLDISPDIYYQSLRDNILLTSISSIVVTHTHWDHLDSFSLALRAREGASRIPPAGKEQLSLYGGASVKNTLDQIWVNQPYANPNRILYHPIKANNPFCIDNIWFYPLEANHKRDEDCFIYAINDKDEWLLYANDTGALSEATMNYIRSLNIQFDVVSMDCSRGTLPGDSHMGLEENRLLKQNLKAYGCVHDRTQYLLNHFSHVCGLTHDELHTLVCNDGFQVTYDGMIIEWKR